MSGSISQSPTTRTPESSPVGTPSACRSARRTAPRRRTCSTSAVAAFARSSSCRSAARAAAAPRRRNGGGSASSTTAPAATACAAGVTQHQPVPGFGRQRVGAASAGPSSRPAAGPGPLPPPSRGGARARPAGRTSRAAKPEQLTSSDAVVRQASGVSRASPRPIRSTSTPRRLTATRATAPTRSLVLARGSADRAPGPAGPPSCNWSPTRERAGCPACRSPPCRRPRMVNDAVDPQPHPPVEPGRRQPVDQPAQRDPQFGQALHRSCPRRRRPHLAQAWMRRSGSGPRPSRRPGRPDRCG